MVFKTTDDPGLTVMLGMPLTVEVPAAVVTGAEGIAVTVIPLVAVTVQPGFSVNETFTPIVTVAAVVSFARL